MADLDRIMNNELLQTLRGLIRNWEHEVVEFKQATNDYDQDKIGQYFSAISNEANLKSRNREFSEAVDLIVEFWKSFSDSAVRKIYNYMKHKGKPIYKECSAIDNIRFSNMYIHRGSGNLVQIASDISDVQMELSLTEEIARLYSFDDEVLFPYIQKLLQVLEETIKPTPFLVT